MDQRKTVLLADAGEEFRTLLWEEMEKTGEFSVEIARDGNEILKRVKERMPDLRERVCQDDFCKFSKFKYLSAEKTPNISCRHIS